MTARTRTDIASGRARPIRHLPDISTHLAFWLPVANVVMQLANPAVGHGVVESRVGRGRGDLRPIKRAPPDPNSGWRCVWCGTTPTSGR